MNFEMLKGMYRIRYENIKGKIYTIAVSPFPFRHQNKDAYGLEFCIYDENNNPYILYVGVTGIVLRSWGITSLTSDDSRVSRFLLIKGFELTMKELDGEKVFENNECLFTTKITPEKLPKISKGCIFLKDIDGNLICKKHDSMDKAKGYTNYLACESCQFPEYFAMCENLINLRTKGVVVDTGQVLKRWVCHVDCKVGCELNTDNLIECLSKPCFVPYLIKSPRRKGKGVQNTHSVLSNCIELIDSINAFCKSKHGFKLFQVHQQKIWLELQKPCLNETDFNSRISALSTLIDWINDKELRKNLKKQPEKGSLNALEKFLKENYPHFSKNLINRLRDIKTLRKKFPIHTDTPQIVQSIKNKAGKYPPEWRKLWDKVILNFLVSLQELEEILEENSK